MLTLEIHERETASDHVIRLVGELDMANCDALEERIAAALRSEPTETVIIDLAALDFMDSYGLRVLVNAAAAAREEGERLIIRKAHGAVARLIDVSGTASLLPLV